MPRLAGIICYICGREFGTKSIGIHEPQCMKKWEVQNNKLPKGKRQSRPVKPVEFDMSFSTNPKERQAQIERLNDASNVAAQENLVPCKHCQRTFQASRIEKHESICTNVKSKPKPVNKVDEPSVSKPKLIPSKNSPQKANSHGPKPSNNQYNTIIKPRKSNESQSKESENSKQSTSPSKNDLSNNEMHDFVVGIKPELLNECSACGRMVLRNVMGIHLEKYCVNSRKEGSPTSPTTGKFVKGRFVDCINCGKSFTVNSLVEHQRKCLAT